MNDLMRYEPQLPGNMRRQLSLQQHRMNYQAQVAMQALDEQSEIYSYTMFKVITTLQEVEMLQIAYPAATRSPEIEAAMQGLKRDYLHVMELIPQHAARMILQNLQQASAPPDDGGLLGALTDAFIEYLAGRR